MLALLPALLAALSGVWCGTFSGGAGWAGSTVAALLPLALLAAAGVDVRDPLRLGRAGRLLPAALWIAAAASAWASPVPRAGRVALILLPGYLALPGAVARCWSSETARRIGLRALAGAVGGVALLALAGIVWLHTERASLPLGHHNLLAAWLVILLPLALLPAREPGGWRWLGWGSGLAGAAAVLASRSLLGLAALGVEITLALAVALRLGAGAAERHPPPSLPPSPPTTPPRGEEPFAGGSSNQEGREPWIPRQEISASGRTASRASLPPGRGRGGDGGRLGGGWNRDDLSDRFLLRRRRFWLASAAALLLLLGGAVEGRRAFRILSGADRSADARAVYYRAGWEGFLARPALGWGPGSTAWTASRFLRPRPGVNPPGEVLGELHSLPVALLYELGGTGFLLAGSLAGLFLVRRRAEQRRAVDSTLPAAGLLGLLGAAVVSLGSASLAVTALPLAAALAAGAALARSPELPELPELPRAGLRFRLPTLAYGVAALLLLSPLLLASYHYDQAITAPTPRRAQDHLARAVNLDPSFPLYRARLGWLLAGSDRRRGADLTLRAAEDASGVSSLWLAAGVLGLGTGRPWAPQALAEACARDPLSPFAPYFLAVAAPGSPVAPFDAAHALLAEPRLLAAPFWDRQGPLQAEALREIGAREGIDRGWREALLRAAGRLSPRSADDGERSWLALEIDPIPSLSLSLYAFRRNPWPLEWPLVEVRQAALAVLDLPPASALPTSTASAFRYRP